MRRGRLRIRFWTEIGAATAATVMTIATIVLPTWAEALFGIDADAGLGWFELAVTIGFAVAAAGAAAMSVLESGRPLPALEGGRR